MKNNIVVTASQIAEILKDEYGAEVAFAPEYDLQEIGKKRRCCVVPVNTEYRNLSRVSVELQYRIEIGFLYRDKRLDMAGEVGQADAVIEKFLFKKINNATCVKAEHVPLYDPEMLRTRNQFTSVIALTFKEVQNV
jgi:hypothetical protein